MHYYVFRPLGYNYPIYLFTIDYFAQTDSAKKKEQKIDIFGNIYAKPIIVFAIRQRS